eukprot:snap_masked-scaffold_34-processed-gene-2.11-mRNA-1 protein AED:1.00 eAED:1.00 QI:0/0/0/0/1/1/2/0/68
MFGHFKVAEEDGGIRSLCICDLKHFLVKFNPGRDPCSHNGMNHYDAPEYSLKLRGTLKKKLDCRDLIF